MKNNDNRTRLVWFLGFLFGISVGGIICLGGFWLLIRMAPGLILEAQNQTTRRSATNQLTVLGNTFSGYSTFRSAAFQEDLKKVGVNLRYEVESDFAKSADLLNQGKADLVLTTLDQFIQQKPQGKIVGLIDRTVGADAVVLNTKKYPSLKSLLDLSQLAQQTRSRGQQLSIAFTGDSPSEYLTLVLNTKFEAFNLSDFQANRVADASDAWKLLQNPSQNVAVAVIWEPYVTQAQQQGYTVVLSSKDAPQAVIDVLVASERLIEAQPELISDFLAAYYSRIDSYILDASQLRNQIAKDSKLSPSDAATVLQGVKFFTAVEAKNWLTTDILAKQISSTAAVLTLAGRLNQVPQNPKDLYISQFIAKPANSTQRLISLARADNPQLAGRLAGKVKAATPNRTADDSKITTAPNIGNLQVRGEVKFAPASAQLTPEGKKTLNQLSEEISEFNEQTVAVRVIGHTSNTGEALFNQRLSRQRAQVVVDYLRSRGLKHKIVAEGRGSSQTLSSIPPNDRRNQRTEIRLVRINN